MHIVETAASCRARYTNAALANYEKERDLHEEGCLNNCIAVETHLSAKYGTIECFTIRKLLEKNFRVSNECPLIVVVLLVHRGRAPP